MHSSSRSATKLMIRRGDVLDEFADMKPFRAKLVLVHGIGP
jgi:hypothetical protein